jgi:hypothetical protein
MTSKREAKEAHFACCSCDLSPSPHVHQHHATTTITSTTVTSTATTVTTVMFRIPTHALNTNHTHRCLHLLLYGLELGLTVFRCQLCLVSLRLLCTCSDPQTLLELSAPSIITNLKALDFSSGLLVYLQTRIAHVRCSC